MIAPKEIPAALTIAGSDSGGGAGIQADLKTFAAMGVHGASAIACLTAQNPKRVRGIEPVSPKILRQQIEAVFDELPPAAVKIGMLFSEENVRAVAKFFCALPARRRIPLIVDPVLISTSGARLIEPRALKILKDRLLPIAALVTPNIQEAEILSGQKIPAIEGMRGAAQKIQSRFGCAVLLKGGHLKGTGRATDLFFDGEDEFFVSAPFARRLRTHGTGCVYSAAICAALALGEDLPQAVRRGKIIVTAAISGSYRIGSHFSLGIQR